MFYFKYNIIPIWYVERAGIMIKEYPICLAFNDGIGWCWQIVKD